MNEFIPLKKIKKLFRNGEYFTVYGLYQYAGHVNDDYNNCRIPDVAYRMVFQEGDKAPGLPSCTHDIQWRLLRER